MQEQIKSLEEKNKKLLLHNRKLSSEIRRVKSQIENVRARDNRHQIQIQEYRKLLNDSRAQNVKLENIIKSEAKGETISPQIKAEIGYDNLCSRNLSDDSSSDDELRSTNRRKLHKPIGIRNPTRTIIGRGRGRGSTKNLKEVCEILSDAFSESESVNSDNYSCQSSILDAYASDLESICEDVIRTEVATLSLVSNISIIIYKTNYHNLGIILEVFVLIQKKIYQ